MRALIKTIFLCLILASCNQNSASDLLTQAEALSEEGRYVEAIQILDKALHMDEKFLGAYINRGADKAAIGNYKEAIADYEKVLAIDPDNTLALFNIGNNYKRLEEYETAISYYNRAFKTKGGETLFLDYIPDNVAGIGQYDVEGRAIYYERGIAYYNSGNYLNALYDLEVALDKGYEAADCLIWLGYIHLYAGRKDRACENFRKSKALGHETADQEIELHCKN